MGGIRKSRGRQYRGGGALSKKAKTDVCCFPPGQILQVSSTCLLERRGDDGPSSDFTTGSSSTCRRSWDTSTTKATALMQIPPRYDGFLV